MAAASLLLLIAPSTAAVVTAPPGTNTTLGNIDAGNASIVRNTFPFDAQIRRSRIIVSPTYDLAPRIYDGQITFRTGNNTTTHSYSVKIPEVSNWTLKPESLNQTISVGSNGQLTNLTVMLKGNTPVRLTANITGNLSEYFETNPFFRIYPGLSETVVLSYQVPKTTSFGHYTGHLILEDGQGRNRTVNLSAMFEDRIQPSIENVVVSDLMATTTETFYATIDDNLRIDSVTAEVFRTVKVEQQNETIQVNETVGTYQLEHLENTDTWKFEFEDTAVIAPYYINITANDTSGNTVHKLERFEVNGLNATHVLRSNFEFTATEPGKEVSEEVLRNDIETPVNLTLTRFQHLEENSSISIGIRKPGDEVAEKFSGEGDTITVREPGVYELVVESDSKGDDFQGRIEVEPVDQHYPVSDIVFEGKVVNPAYPECANMSIGEFEGRICFEDVNRTVHRRIEFVASAPADDCKGVEEWSQCIAGYTLGELQEVKQENQSLKNARGRWQFVAFLTVFGFVAYQVKEQKLRGLIPVLPKFDRDELDKTWKDFENGIEA